MGDLEGPRITIYDYNVGNLHSIGKALELAGASVKVARSVDHVIASDPDALVFPGVGDFGEVMRTIGKGKRHLRSMLEVGIPCLGICIGFQIMFEESEEARNKGLGFLKGKVERFKGVRLPHMGWNQVTLSKGASKDPLLRGLPGQTHFYFANSYAPRPRGGRRLGRTVYGRGFPSIMRKLNTYGTQFHPEKSGSFGLKLIRNFVDFAAMKASR